MPENVFKRGSVYYIRYDLPPTEDGARRQKMKACQGMSEQQAKKELARIIADIAKGKHVEPTDVTLVQYLGAWLEHCEARGLAASTLVGYQGCIDRYILPQLGRVRLSRLKPLTLQQFLNDASGFGKKKQTLAPKTIYNIHGVLRKALKQAVWWELIPRNPMDSVEPPKLRLREMPTGGDAEWEHCSC